MRAGTLHRIHRGVYAVGHPRLEERGLWMAAVLAAGDGAALAGLSAASLWRISRWNPVEIHVIAPGHRRRRVDFRLQTTRNLDPRDITRQHGIPVTSVARTLVDLTDILTAPQLANVIHEAAFRKRFDDRAVRTAMARANGRMRLSVLSEALELNRGGSAGTKSQCEDRFLELLGDRPGPRINVEVEGILVDFAWPGTIVEIDGRGHERARTRAEDERRDARLRAAGYRVIRIPAERLD